MASPFARFRKNQKLYLALMGVVLMIAFVFGGVTCSNQGPQYEDSVVASTKYGEVHKSGLQRMLQNQSLVNRFLTQLVALSAEKSLKSSNFPPNFLNQFINFEIQRLQQEGLLSEESETSAIDTMILAQKAEELGLVVSNDAIKDFIVQRTNRQVTESEAAQIISNLGVPQQRIFDALRTQLLSVRVRNQFFRGLTATPPGQQWEYYQRLNRRARGEVVSVSVASFTSQVQDPSEAELRKFFDEHKNRLPSPGSSEPGLKQPHQLALQYLKAEHDKFYDEAAVTEEQIKEQYDKAKDTAYLYTDPPLETKPADETPATDEKDEKKDPTPENKTPENKEEQQESSDSDNLENCQDNPPESEQPPATETKPAEPKTTETPPAETPKTTQPAEPALEGIGIQTPPKQTEQGPSLLDLSGKYGLPRDIREGPKPKNAPFWSVKDSIRKQLARQQANKKMDEALDKVRPVLNKYYDAFALWKSEHPDLKDDPAHPRPKRPDIVALAKEHGLSAHETGLLSIQTVLTETEVGQAIMESSANPVFVSQALESPPVYKEQTIQDRAGNLYLYWKTQDVPEHVPNFDEPETKSEVLAVWKLTQARDLAKKQADQLAEQARAAGVPLAEAFANQKDLAVKSIGPFTWMTQGDFLGPQEPRLTTVAGVDTAGTDFMRTVFELAPGEVGVAFNAPKNNVYVVRLMGLEPSPIVLREKFLAETSSTRQQQTYSTLSFDDNMQMSRDWLKDIRTAAGLHWNREAYVGSRME